MRVRAVVATTEPAEALAAVIEETEARCPVMNLLRDTKVDLWIEWVRSSDRTLEALPGAEPPTNVFERGVELVERAEHPAFGASPIWHLPLCFAADSLKFR